MIFTRTKMDADRLYAAIHNDGEHKVAVMHGDIAQKDRETSVFGLTIRLALRELGFEFVA